MYFVENVGDSSELKLFVVYGCNGGRDEKKQISFSYIYLFPGSVVKFLYGFGLELVWRDVAINQRTRYVWATSQ